MSNALHVALTVLAVVGVAHAQTEDSLSLTLTSSALVDAERLLAGGPDCASDITSTLNLNGTLTGSFSGYELRLTWTTGTTACDRSIFGSCSNSTETSGEETCGCITEVTDTAEITSQQYDFTDLFADPCTPSDGVTEYDIRFYLEYFNTTDSTTVTSAPLIVTFDFDPPSPPAEQPTVTAGDGALNVSFVESTDSDVAGYRVCYALTGTFQCTGVTSDTSERIDNLINGELYTVYVEAVDYAGNTSAPSQEAEGTPEESQDFAEFYSNIPGQATGCNTQPGGDSPTWLWALLPLLALRRRRAAFAFAGIALLVMTQPAFARVDKETARDSVFEFRMGSYLPNIDDEFGDACNTQNCPYAAAFESGDPFMFTFAYSRHLFTGFGTLSAGGGFGYWNNDEGRAIRSKPTDTLSYADEGTEISVYPLFLEIGYRLDVIQDIVPLVPAVKIGVDAYGWRIFDGAGEVARFREFGTENDAGAAQGFSYGWHASLGVHILLDYFAPDMAADFDRDAGVNNSYLTLDYQTAQISNFGAGETLWLGSDVLFIGLALDM